MDESCRSSGRDARGPSINGPNINGPIDNELDPMLLEEWPQFVGAFSHELVDVYFLELQRLRPSKVQERRHHLGKISNFAQQRCRNGCAPFVQLKVLK